MGEYYRFKFQWSFQAIKNLYAQNELRLEHLNERSIRRPSAASTGFGKFPK